MGPRYPGKQRSKDSLRNNYHSSLSYHDTSVIKKMWRGTCHRKVHTKCE